MVVIRLVKTFDLPSLFSPRRGNVKCSLDNRVAILHRKGAAVYVSHSPLILILIK
jgi:hypothetical protein